MSGLKKWLVGSLFVNETVQIVLLLSSVSMTLLGLLLLHLAQKHKGLIHGIKNWGGAFLLVAIAQLLFLASGAATISLVLILSHTVLLIGLMLANSGTRQFFNEPSPYRPSYVQLFAISFVALLVWFTVFDDSLRIRTMVYGIFGAVVLGDTFLVLFRQKGFGSGLTILIASISLLLISRIARFLAAIFDMPLSSLADTFEPTTFHLLLLSLLSIIAPFIAIAFLMLSSDALIAQLRKANRYDQLTGVLNKTALQSDMQHEILRAKRHSRPLSIMMIDLDNFKSINDTLGHLKGDEILKQAASKISESVRAIDLVARFGGDEFTVLCLETDAENARNMAQRTLDNLNQLLPGHCSASIGVASLDIGKDGIDDFMHKADLALYQAKNLGKSRVTVFKKAEPDRTFIPLNNEKGEAASDAVVSNILPTDATAP